MSIPGYRIKVRVTLLEEQLGTGSSNPDIHREYIASKAPDAASIEDEVAAHGVDEVERKDMTVFPKDENGNPFMYNYQLKGFFKDACQALSRVKPMRSYDLTAFKKVIDGNVFVYPRKIPFKMQTGAVMGNCQRPLRAETAQGPRIALANSETVPADSVLEFEILLLDKNLKDVVIEWLNYGDMRGLGQWRNSGKGIFAYEITGEEDERNGVWSETKEKKGRKNAKVIETPALDISKVE